MLDLLRNFSTLDLALIGTIALVSGLLLRRWYALAWAVMAALTADFALPFLYYVVTGVGIDNSWGRAAARFVNNDGGLLILRTAVYFAAIAVVFGIKSAWKRR